MCYFTDLYQNENNYCLILNLITNLYVKSQHKKIEIPFLLIQIIILQKFDILPLPGANCREGVNFLLFSWKGS